MVEKFVFKLCLFDYLFKNNKNIIIRTEQPNITRSFTFGLFFSRELWLLWNRSVKEILFSNLYADSRMIHKFFVHYIKFVSHTKLFHTELFYNNLYTSDDTVSNSELLEFWTENMAKENLNDEFWDILFVFQCVLLCSLLMRTSILFMIPTGYFVYVEKAHKRSNRTGVVLLTIY